MIPNGWHISDFGEVTTIGSGQVDPRKPPYLDMTHIGPENIESDSGRIIAPSTCRELGLISGKYEFDEKAVVYSKIRPHLNKVCYPRFKGICSADAYPIWPQVDKLSPEYLMLYMLSPVFEKRAVACSMRTGMPKINREDLQGIPIRFPSLIEQKSIANVILTWTHAIDVTEKLLANSRKQKQALVQRQFSSTSQKRRASEIFIPNSVRRNGGLELLSVMQDVGVIPRRLLDRKVAMPDGTTEAYKLVESGDFVISLRSFEGGLEYSRFKGLVSPAYTVLKPRLAICDDFYRHYFKSREFISRLSVAVIGIRDGKQISYEDFSFLKLPYPEITEQKRIAAILNQAEALIEGLQQQLEKLHAEKSALMAQLLTGKRRVKLDEPAEEASAT